MSGGDMSWRDRPDLYCPRCHLPLEEADLAEGEHICRWCRIPASAIPHEAGQAVEEVPVSPAIPGVALPHAVPPEPSAASPQVMESGTSASAAGNPTTPAGTARPDFAREQAWSRRGSKRGTGYIRPEQPNRVAYTLARSPEERARGRDAVLRLTGYEAIKLIAMIGEWFDLYGAGPVEICGRRVGFTLA